MHQQTHGFVFIELLIVLFIIGVLASVAIPGYTDYVKRAEIASAFSLVQPLQRQIADYYAWHGDFPANASALALAAPVAKTERIKQIEINNGTIIISLQLAELSLEVAPQLLLTPVTSDNYGPLRWSCQPNTQQMSAFLPSTCR